MGSLESSIVAEGRRFGFAAVGFARVGPSETYRRFREWLDSGRAADMDYLHRHEKLRADPRELAGGAHTLIVAAAPYPTHPAPGRGVASYAAGRDYHLVVRDKLRDLAAFIGREQPLSVARVCVDSAPLLEREWAVRAGVGWRGKQGQLVTSDSGCSVVLGELLVDLDLEPSSPVANQCGECRKCLEACPTGALGEEGLVDARCCASYLTIEHKGDFSVEQAAHVGTALFGCDRCTAVCPWNGRAMAGAEAGLGGRVMPTSAEFLTMTDDAFEERFRDTALHRTGLAALQRNARAAISNAPA